MLAVSTVKRREVFLQFSALFCVVEVEQWSEKLPWKTLKFCINLFIKRRQSTSSYKFVIYGTQT